MILFMIIGKYPEVYADTEFYGNWHRPTASNDPANAKSRSGYVILYARYHKILAYKLKTVITLSSTEAEFISLSQPLRYLIPLMGLKKESKTFGFEVFWKNSILHCKAFEDKSGTIELARLKKYVCALNTKTFSSTTSGLIHILQVSTCDQCADAWTKPLLQNVFLKHRKMIIGL